MNSKHMKEEPSKIKKILKVSLMILLLIGVLTAVVVILYVKYIEAEEEKRIIPTVTTIWKQAEVSFLAIQENKLSELQVVEVDMPEKMKSYSILGEIEIPKINLKKYILDHYTDESLDLSVTRFWGNGIHEAGNFSIIGHNYKGMFRDLKELEIGDTFTITDREGRICTYVIYENFIVEPDDVSCIEDTLKGKREVTLITCTTGGAKRLILKAKEQN